jgi:hypothetical protein
MELSPSWEAVNCVLRNFPAFYGTWRFITVFTKVLHWSLSWATSTQPIPLHPIPLRSFLILSTHLRLGLLSGLFPSGFPANILYAFLFSPTHATCPAYRILLVLVILIILAKSTSYGAPHYAVFSNLPSLHLSSVQIFSSAPCSQTTSVCVLTLMLETKFRNHREPQTEF